MPKLTPREKMRAWREKSLENVSAAAVRLSAILGEAKKLKSELARTLDRISASSENIRGAIEQGIEDRQGELWEALVKKHGEAEALAMIDDADTSEEEERDEATRDQIDELSYPDPEDDLAQAIESMENLAEGLSELVQGIREIK